MASYFVQYCDQVKKFTSPTNKMEFWETTMMLNKPSDISGHFRLWLNCNKVRFNRKTVKFIGTRSICCVCLCALKETAIQI